MPNNLLAHMPAARLDAMKRARQAKRITAVAAEVLRAGPTWADLDDLDRLDLARLLAAVGDAWSAAERRKTKIGEKLCWSATCAIANRIAERWDSEIALAEALTETAGHPVPIGNGNTGERNRNASPMGRPARECG